MSDRARTISGNYASDIFQLSLLPTVNDKFVKLKNIKDSLIKYSDDYNPRTGFLPGHPFKVCTSASSPYYRDGGCSNDETQVTQDATVYIIRDIRLGGARKSRKHSRRTRRRHRKN